MPLVPLAGLPNKKVQDKDTEDLSLTEELLKKRLLNRKQESQRLSHIKLLEMQRLQDEDDTREEEKDTRKPPPPGKSESPRLSTSEWRKKQKLLLKKKAATCGFGDGLSQSNYRKPTRKGMNRKNQAAQNQKTLRTLTITRPHVARPKLKLWSVLGREKRGLTLQKRWKCYVLLKHR
jgi:hypothetical protein